MSIDINKIKLLIDKVKLSGVVTKFTFYPGKWS